MSLSDLWVHYSVNLHQKPKVIAIARLAGIKDSRLAAAMLAQVWGWTLVMKARNEFIPMPASDPEVIDEVVNCKGFGKAMVSVQWLEVTDEGLRFPGLSEHVPDLESKREKERDRKAEQRSKNKGCPADVPRDSNGTHHGTADGFPAGPSSSPRDQTKTESKDDPNNRPGVTVPDPNPDHPQDADARHAVNEILLADPGIALGQASPVSRGSRRRSFAYLTTRPEFQFVLSQMPRGC